MGGTHSAQRNVGNLNEILRNVKGVEYLEDLGTDGRIIAKLILK